MAKTARRSVTSNPSSLTSSSLYSNTNSSAHINGDYYQKTSTNNSSPSSATIDPLRSTNYHQFTTRTVSNYGRHGNRTTVRSFSNSSSSRSNSENLNISSNSTNSTTSQEFNSTTAADRLAAERERIRTEFYATYDVMTGVRIAATLGGFFGLMVFLVVYKSRSHSHDTLKVLKDPKIAAVAAACMQEEEEREIQQAIEATGLSIYPDEYDTMFFRRQRMLSLGNVSAPPVLHRNFRFSSVGGGGYSSLLEPPRRYSYSGSRRNSVSQSSRILSAYPMGGSFGTDDYFIETDDELENEFDRLSTRDDSNRTHALLEVPIAGQESRRSSGMTCCSTESSYLERRCSAITLGLSALPSTLQTKISLGASSRRSSTDFWDYYYPDIQVIRPTPKTSPCPSERSLHDKTKKTKAIEANTISQTDNDSYYNQCSKMFIKKDPSFDSENVAHNQLDKRSFSISTDSHDNQRSCPIYGDNNELKLAVKRKISDPSNNNHIYNSNNNSSYNQSTQYASNDNSRRAPLASISSFKISSIDYQDSDLKSLGSDSVFVESYADTDDDMEQFSTDSDEISISIGADTHRSQPETSPHAIRRHHGIGQQISLKSDISQHSNEINKKLVISSKRNRPTLERHRTISTTSNDRVMLISQHSQELKDDASEHFNGKDLTRSSSYISTTIPKHLMPGDATSIRKSESSITSSTLNTEIQKPTTSFSYDNNNDSFSCSISNNRYNKNDKSKNCNSNNENVEVNVIIENRPTIISPSVILELPVIALPSQADDPPRDPSLPGTSRKWSKETLF